MSGRKREMKLLKDALSRDEAQLISGLAGDRFNRAKLIGEAAYYTGWFLSGAVVAGIAAVAGRLALPGAGWRWAFWVMGAVGLVLGVAFFASGAARCRTYAGRPSPS